MVARTSVSSWMALALCGPRFVGAWMSHYGLSSPAPTRHTNGVSLDMAAVGVFFGTSTGSTQTCAEKIYEAFGDDVAYEPIDVDTLDEGQIAQVFTEHDALVVGTPTWNTGADTERSGTGWDELYYGKLPELKDALQGKKVAVFGLGDQISYAENYADATGELFDVFEGLGCQMLGSWSQEGYEHEASKSIRGDKFCGLLLDMVNQEELTDERVEQWVEQLKDEGILDGATGGSVPAQTEVINGATVDAVVIPPPAPAPPAAGGGGDRLSQLESENAELRRMLEENSKILNENIGSHSTGGFTPHYNPVKGKTMWTSPDGTKSYVTTDAPTHLNP